MIIGNAISICDLRKKSSSNGNDADAQAFITASGISGTEATAVNTLVVSLKSANIWTKIKAAYPFVGSSATSCKWNLKDARDLDAAYRLFFNGGGTFSSAGYLPNGTNAYANTFLNPSTQLTATSVHLSYYSRTATPVGATVEIGNNNGSANIFHIRTAANFIAGSSATTLMNFTTTTNAQGFWLGTKRANNDREIYRNGITQTTSTTNDTTAFTSVNLYLGATNQLGTTASYSNKQCAFASIGDGLTDAEVTAFYNAVQQFNTTLGRQV